MTRKSSRLSFGGNTSNEKQQQEGLELFVMRSAMGRTVAMAMWRKLSIEERAEYEQEARILNFGGNTGGETENQGQEEVLEEAFLLSSDDEAAQDAAIHQQVQRDFDLAVSVEENQTNKKSDLFDSEDSADAEHLPEAPGKPVEVPAIKKQTTIPEAFSIKASNFYGKKEQVKKSEQKKDFSNIASSSTTDTEDEVPEIKLSERPKKKSKKSSLILFDSSTSSSESEDEKVLPKKKRKATIESSSSSSDGGETLFSMKKKIAANKTEAPRSKPPSLKTVKDKKTFDRMSKPKDVFKASSKLLPPKLEKQKLSVEPDKKLKASLVLSNVQSRRIENPTASTKPKEAKVAEKPKSSQKDAKPAKSPPVLTKQPSSLSNFKIPKKISPEQREKEQKARERLKKRIEDLSERISGKTRRFKQMTTEKSKKKEKQSLDELREERLKLIQQLEKKVMSDEEKKLRSEIKFERTEDYDLKFSDFEKTRTITVQAVPKCQYHPCARLGVLDIDKVKYCSQACLHKYVMDLHRMLMESMFAKKKKASVEGKRKKGKDSVEETPPKKSKKAPPAKNAEIRKGSSGNHVRRLSDDQVMILNKGLKDKSDFSEKSLKDHKSNIKGEAPSAVTSAPHKNLNVAAQNAKLTKEKTLVDGVKYEVNAEKLSQSKSRSSETDQSELLNDKIRSEVSGTVDKAKKSSEQTRNSFKPEASDVKITSMDVDCKTSADKIHKSFTKTSQSSSFESQPTNEAATTKSEAAINGAPMKSANGSSENKPVMNFERSSTVSGNDVEMTDVASDDVSAPEIAAATGSVMMTSNDSNDVTMQKFADLSSKYISNE